MSWNMKYHSQYNKCVFSIIAETGDRFTDFSPYVASINNKGIVSFQAESANGITGIYSGDGDSLNTILESAGSNFNNFYSHPDLNDNDEYCFYAELISGSQGIFLCKNGEVISLAQTDNIFKSIGPLGPVMNEDGAVAFRAELNSGCSGIFIYINGKVKKITDTETIFRDFSGLPVINNTGMVAFKAILKNDVQGIYRRNDGSIEVIADTNSEFQEFGRFTDINDDGIIVFSALKKDGSSGIYTLFKGELNAAVVRENGFESFRTALINNSGKIIFYGVTQEGTEGIFKGNDPKGDMIISLNDNLFESTVKEIAFNPVSLNNKDQIAFRIKLENNHQLIIRADLF